MLLAVDIGNTNIVLGLYDGSRLRHHWRVRTDRQRTADEYGLLFTHLMQIVGLHPTLIDGAIVGNVVPPLNRTISMAIDVYFGMKPLFVSPELDLGIGINYPNPTEIGADRLVNAVAAVKKYGAPAIVVDLGTATTFDVVDDTPAYCGGVILPGLETSAEGLYLKTSRLPRVSIEPPLHAIGKSTVEAMQSGLYYSYAGGIDAMICRVVEELGGKPVVIATGGHAAHVAQACSQINDVDPWLTLDGLYYVWQRVHPE